jgi:uncharacterized protein (DUF2345 family)
MALLSADGMTLTTSNNPLALTANGVGMTLNATDDIVLTSSAESITLNAILDVNLTATNGVINITSTNDQINLTANTSVFITSNTENIELIPFNDDGLTESGIVRINKNNSLLYNFDNVYLIQIIS